jgi:hypothetical protein
MTKKLPDAAVKALARGVPADRVLTPHINLTPKQKSLVEALASGATKREAYLATHEPKTRNSKTLTMMASRAAAADNVQAALSQQQAVERLRYSQNPSQIREWLTDQLQHEARTAQRPGDRLRALELLGKLALVGAFENRSVVEHRKAPDDMRQALLAKLARLGGVVDVQAIEANPTPPPPPQTGHPSRARTASINPHQQSQDFVPTPHDVESLGDGDGVIEEMAPHEKDLGSHTGGGKKEKPLWEDPKRWYEHHYGEIKMEDEMPREEFAKRFREMKDDSGAA